MRTIALLTAAVLALAAPTPAQDFRSSVVGTDFDIIRDEDPTTFLCLEFKGEGPREMPDKTGPSALVQPAFLFVAYFNDGTQVDFALDADFGSEEAARAEALRYAPRLGKLPTKLRRGVERLVVHKGHADATAFSDVGLIVVYSDNATKRIGTHDLEETLFHESVHAAWDKTHADSEAWRRAQNIDGEFATHYARKNPDREDLAESALFAYAILHHRGRIPALPASRISGAIPARIAFVRKLLPPDEPLLFPVGPAYPCDGSGTTFTVAEERLAPAAAKPCRVDITTVGVLSDILSNALMRGLEQKESDVRRFLTGAKARCKSSNDLVDETAAAFGIKRTVLVAKVEEFYHCNCKHREVAGVAAERVAAVLGRDREQKITTFLWFDDQALEAARFYVSVFDGARIVAPPPTSTEAPALVVFEIEDQRFMALNGGPQYEFSEAVSLYVACDDQMEVDRYWERLTDGGEPGRCGWLKDRYGLSWQIVPKALPELLGDPDPTNAARVMEALLGMTKIDVAALEAAHRGD